MFTRKRCKVRHSGESQSPLIILGLCVPIIGNIVIKQEKKLDSDFRRNDKLGGFCVPELWAELTA